MKKIGVVSLLTIFAVVLAVFVMATTVTKSPTACAGGWTSCSNANANGGGAATAAVTSSKNVTGNWSNYGGFNTTNSSNVTNVTVAVDFFASNVRGFINVQVSGDGGATYGPSHIVGGNTVEQTYTIDVTADNTWTHTKLSNSNFVTKVTCFKSGSGGNPTCNLDWIRAQAVSSP